MHATEPNLVDFTALLPVIHALPEAAGLVDSHGRLCAANSQLVQLFGAPFCGRTLLELTGSEPLFEAAARALGGAGCLLALELPLLERTWQVRLAPLRPGVVLLVVRDLTGPRRAAALRDRLLEGASEEARAALSRITVATAALGELDTRARTLAQIGARSAERLQGVIDELIGLAREMGAPQVELLRR